MSFMQEIRKGIQAAKADAELGKKTTLKEEMAKPGPPKVIERPVLGEGFEKEKATAYPTAAPGYATEAHAERGHSPTPHEGLHRTEAGKMAGVAPAVVPTLAAAEIEKGKLKAEELGHRVEGHIPGTAEHAYREEAGVVHPGVYGKAEELKYRTEAELEKEKLRAKEMEHRVASHIPGTKEHAYKEAEMGALPTAPVVGVVQPGLHGKAEELKYRTESELERERLRAKEMEQRVASHIPGTKEHAYKVEEREAGLAHPVHGRVGELGYVAGAELEKGKLKAEELGHRVESHIPGTKEHEATHLMPEHHRTELLGTEYEKGRVLPEGTAHPIEGHLPEERVHVKPEHTKTGELAYAMGKTAQKAELKAEEVGHRVEAHVPHEQVYVAPEAHLRPEERVEFKEGERLGQITVTEQKLHAGPEVVQKMEHLTLEHEHLPVKTEQHMVPAEGHLTQRPAEGIQELHIAAKETIVTTTGEQVKLVPHAEGEYFEKRVEEKLPAAHIPYETKEKVAPTQVPLAPQPKLEGELITTQIVTSGGQLMELGPEGAKPVTKPIIINPAVIASKPLELGPVLKEGEQKRLPEGH